MLPFYEALRLRAQSLLNLSEVPENPPSVCFRPR